MSSSGEKKHPASHRKLRKAREEGNVAQSATFTASFATLVLSVGLGWVLTDIGSGFVVRSREFVAGAASIAGTEGFGPSLTGARRFALDSILSVAPVLVIATAVAILVGFLQVGPVVATKSLVPKLERLNPIEGLKNRIFSARAFVDLVRNVLTVLLLGLVLGMIIYDEAASLLRLPYLPLGDAAAEIARVSSRLLWWGGIIFVVIGVADFAWQRHKYLSDQRMTDQEVKEETRDDQGDPEIVRARKRRHKEIVQENSQEQIRRASFLARNPTHIACAVLYDPRVHSAPMVIAKGADLMALRMVDIARESGVEMIEDIPFARALYRVPVGMPIPAEMLAAVQAVLEQIQERMLRRGECPRWLPPLLSAEELARLEERLHELRSNRESTAIDECAATPDPEAR